MSIVESAMINNTPTPHIPKTRERRSDVNGGVIERIVTASMSFLLSRSILFLAAPEICCVETTDELLSPKIEARIRVEKASMSTISTKMTETAANALG